MILLADSKGPDQTARLRSLIWAFVVRICPKTRFRLVRPIFALCFLYTFGRSSAKEDGFVWLPARKPPSEKESTIKGANLLPGYGGSVGRGGWGGGGGEAKLALLDSIHRLQLP